MTTKLDFLNRITNIVLGPEMIIISSSQLSQAIELQEQMADELAIQNSEFAVAALVILQVFYLLEGNASDALSVEFSAPQIRKEICDKAAEIYFRYTYQFPDASLMFPPSAAETDLDWLQRALENDKDAQKVVSAIFKTTGNEKAAKYWKNVAQEGITIVPKVPLAMGPSTLQKDAPTSLNSPTVVSREELPGTTIQNAVDENQEAVQSVTQSADSNSVTGLVLPLYDNQNAKSSTGPKHLSPEHSIEHETKAEFQESLRLLRKESAQGLEKKIQIEEEEEVFFEASQEIVPESEQDEKEVKVEDAKNILTTSEIQAAYGSQSTLNVAAEPEDDDLIKYLDEKPLDNNALGLTDTQVTDAQKPLTAAISTATDLISIEEEHSVHLSSAQAAPIQYYDPSKLSAPVDYSEEVVLSLDKHTISDSAPLYVEEAVVVGTEQSVNAPSSTLQPPTEPERVYISQQPAQEAEMEIEVIAMPKPKAPSQAVIKKPAPKNAGCCSF